MRGDSRDRMVMGITTTSERRERWFPGLSEQQRRGSLAGEAIMDVAVCSMR